MLKYLKGLKGLRIVNRFCVRGILCNSLRKKVKMAIGYVPRIWTHFDNLYAILLILAVISNSI